MPAEDLLEYVSALLDWQTKTALSGEKPPILDFDDADMDDEDYECYTGLNREHFDDLLSHVQQDLRNSAVRSVRQALGLLLCKLRMDNSQEQLRRLCGMSQPTVSEAISAVLNALDQNFTPLNLGYDHISREDFIAQHQTDVTTVLCNRQPNAAVAVLDGTYLEVQKSSNFCFQRDTYSMLKSWNLLKPMMICAPDGYILNVEALFYGSDNDATMMNYCMHFSSFLDYFEEQDVMIVDRGFRDVLPALWASRIETFMPHFLQPGQKQFTTEQANDNRIVSD